MDTVQIKRQLAALGQPTYGIAKMRWSEELNRPLKQEDFRNWPQMEKQLSRYAHAEKSGENLYIRAVPTIAHEIIFLDDVTPDAITFLKNQGVIPACVVQTSTAETGVPRLHAWIRLADAQEAPTRKAIEKILIDRLHAEFPDPVEKNRPGDRGSNDGIHLGRLAGSWNYGLKKPRNCPVELMEATGYILPPDVSAALLTEATPFIDLTPRKRKVDADVQAIIDHVYERPEIVSTYIQKVVPKMDTSQEHYRQDFFAVSYLLNAKFCDMDIIKCLFDHDPNPIQERKAGREAYWLHRTVEEAKAHMRTKPSPRQKSVTPPAGGRGVHASAGAEAGFMPSNEESAVVYATDLSPEELAAAARGMCHGTVSRDGVVNWGKSYAECIII